MVTTAASPAGTCYQTPQQILRLLRLCSLGASPAASNLLSATRTLAINGVVGSFDSTWPSNALIRRIGIDRFRTVWQAEACTQPSLFSGET